MVAVLLLGFGFGLWVGLGVRRYAPSQRDALDALARIGARRG